MISKIIADKIEPKIDTQILYSHDELIEMGLMFSTNFSDWKIYKSNERLYCFYAKSGRLVFDRKLWKE